MRMAISAAIKRLIEAQDGICCPACWSMGPFVHQVARRSDNNIKAQVEADFVHSYDSFRCIACHQRWTSAFRLVYSPSVEYTEVVGDKIDETKPLTELL